MEKPVQFVQHDIGQERRDHATLRNPFGRRMNNAVDLHARLQQAVDQTEELVVHHLFPDAPQDRLVRNLVKAGFDIALDDPGEAR